MTAPVVESPATLVSRAALRPGDLVFWSLVWAAVLAGNVERVAELVAMAERQAR